MGWEEKKFEEKLHKSFNSFVNNLAGMRAGTATTGLIDNVTVDAYGGKTKLSQLASIDVSGNLELSVRPFDSSLNDTIQKGIQMANLGLTCAFTGSGITVKMPPLTESVRKDLVKTVDKLTEEAKVSMRNIRRDEMEALKTLQKSKEISEDTLRKLGEKVQKLLDKTIERTELESDKKKRALLG